MNIRILREKRAHPKLKCGEVYDVAEDVALDFLRDSSAEPVRGVKIEREVAPPVAERVAKTWPLKTPPADYLEQHAEDDDPSDLVAERLALARELVETE